MKQRTPLIILTLIIILSGSHNTMAIEEAPYAVVKTEAAFEIRDYAPSLLAETLVDADFEKAGSSAFRRLFRYISGDNQSQTKIAMTAPVAQTQGENIAMTAPVGQQKSGDRWAVSFMMPASYSIETLPTPDDPLIRLRQVPARRVATVRYSGFWSKKNYQQNKAKLDVWIQQEGLTVNGEAVWARYNAPFVPWFMRRNEILIPVAH
ncbi:SOUL family heme-binding protein [Geopsychrobacter electrodiphilus]|uniref:SOUL family heme-binding protein n=1 Tax=Geopsychrobacter electrodiphilus TaxID=225196 RepID=UPI000375D22F|nr:heme-binding protein [Geopsychrobacter electrodiphilus]